MGFRSLASCVDALRAEGQAVVIAAPVDPHLEIAEIQRRLYRSGGPAVPFTNPRGCPFPILVNLCGTRKRVERIRRHPRPCPPARRVEDRSGRRRPPPVALLAGAAGCSDDASATCPPRPGARLPGDAFFPAPSGLRRRRQDTDHPGPDPGGDPRTARHARRPGDVGRPRDDRGRGADRESRLDGGQGGCPLPSF